MTTPLLHPVTEAAAILGIGRSMLYQLMAAGEIQTVKIGRRTLVTQAELERYVQRLIEESAR